MKRREFLRQSAAASFCVFPQVADAAPLTPPLISIGLQHDMRPYDLGYTLGRFFTAAATHETLVQLGTRLEMLPGLAQSWEQINPTRWRFQLRENVRFHDGALLTAEGVRQSLQKSMQAVPGLQNDLRLQDILVINEQVIEFETYIPFAGLLAQLSRSVTAIHSPRSFDSNNRLVEIIGTGPWQMQSHVPSERTRLVRVEGHWSGLSPALEKIEYRYIYDDARRVQAFLNDEIQVLLDVPILAAPRLRAASHFHVAEAPMPGGAFGSFNCAAGRVFHDKRLRQAINALVDRDLILAGALEGQGKPAWDVSIPSIVHSSEPINSPYRYDPDAAARLFESAGLKRRNGVWCFDGRGFEVDVCSFYNGMGNAPLAQMLCVALRREGVESNLMLSTQELMLDSLRRGTYDICVQNWGYELIGDPDHFLTAHFTADAPLNYQHWQNEKLTDLLDEARGRPRDDATTALYVQGLQILQDEAVTLPLLTASRLIAMRGDLQGYEPHASRNYFNISSLKY